MLSTNSENIQVLVVNNSELPLPEYATPQAAGMDLRAAVEQPVEIKPGQHVLIPTGLHIQLPDGYELQLRPRSGLALKHGITLLNSPGTIDADYRGEIGVILINHGRETVTVSRGDRLCQAVLAKYRRIEWTAIDMLDDTERGQGGFGHTGNN